MRNKLENLPMVLVVAILILIAIVILVSFGEPKEVSEKNIEVPVVSTTSTTTSTTTTSDTQIATQVATKNTTKVRSTSKKVTNSQVKSGKYKLTHYGPNCKGCSGITASGYNVKNTIWYNDKEYGQVRVVATSSQFKMYSIIKIKDYKLGGDITAIVLDRGVGSGVIDLLVASEKAATQLGIQKVEIEVLRKGK